MKKIIIIFVSLLLVTLAYALDECAPEMETVDLPCQVTTTYPLPNDCDTYGVTLYDENNATLHTTTLDDFGIFCNFTFNYTEAGTYYFNITNGETGGILVREKMQQIANILLFGGYLVAVFILIIFMHVFKDDTGTPVVYGTIATVLSAIMTGVLLSGFQVIYGVTLFFDINYYLASLCAGIGLYTGLVAWTFWGDNRVKEPSNY